jgi:hypothetical protein
MATRRKQVETQGVAMVEPKRPRTVCVECAHMEIDFEQCCATVLAWDPVSGEPFLAQCADVNDGECAKWEAKPPIPPYVFPPQPELGAYVEMPVLSTPPATPVWWIGVILCSVVVAAGAAICGWALWANGWHL